MTVLNLVKSAPPVAAPVQPHSASFWQRVFCMFGQHEMKVKDESRWKKTDNGKVIAEGPLYILQCKHCGSMKAECL